MGLGFGKRTPPAETPHGGRFPANGTSSLTTDADVVRRQTRGLFITK
jgi:hypothetical protein